MPGTVSDKQKLVGRLEKELMQYVRSLLVSLEDLRSECQFPGFVVLCWTVAEAGGELRCVPDFATARCDCCFSPGHWEHTGWPAVFVRSESPDSCPVPALTTQTRCGILPPLAPGVTCRGAVRSLGALWVSARQPSKCGGYLAPPPVV